MVQVIDHAEKLYGKPKKKLKPRIFVEARPVDFEPLSDTGHMYLVYQDENGKEWALSGRPNKYSQLDYELSPIVAEEKPISESIDQRNGATPKQRGQVELDLNGKDATEVWQQMLISAKRITDAKIDYDTIGPNSNSVIHYLIESQGFNPENFLPNTPGIKDGFILKKFPGRGKIIEWKDGKLHDKSIETWDSFSKGLRYIPTL